MLKHSWLEGRLRLSTLWSFRMTSWNKGEKEEESDTESADQDKVNGERLGCQSVLLLSRLSKQLKTQLWASEATMLQSEIQTCVCAFKLPVRIIKIWSPLTPANMEVSFRVCTVRRCHAHVTKQRLPAWTQRPCPTHPLQIQQTCELPSF